MTPLHLHHADPATTIRAQLLLVAQCGNLNPHLLRYLKDRLTLGRLNILPVNFDFDVFHVVLS
jgi:hypothetical protein